MSIVIIVWSHSMLFCVVRDKKKLIRLINNQLHYWRRLEIKKLIKTSNNSKRQMPNRFINEMIKHFIVEINKKETLRNVILLGLSRKAFKRKK